MRLLGSDFGLEPLRAPADEDLHDLIAERCEQATTIVTSDPDRDEWDHAFVTNRLLTSATLDRLRHSAYCLEFDGPTWRDPKVPPASNKTAPKTSSTQAKQDPQRRASRRPSARPRLADICRLRVAG